MRELTFLGYLTKYVRELSYGNTNSIFKLASEASDNNFRLREPLALYAICADKTDLLLRATKNDKLRQTYQSMFQSYDKNSIEAALANQSDSLSIAYHKVWNSYQVYKNKLTADNHTKELMRTKIKELQLQKSITNYQIYSSLNLNKGNVNAWLKAGDSNKVSLETARLIFKYMQDVHNT